MVNIPEAMPRHELERKLRRSRTVNIVLGAVAVLGLVFGGVQWNEAEQARAGGETGAGAGSGQAAANGASEGGQANNAAPALERRDPADPMAIGDVDAPVVLNEWVDLRCPFCAVFSRDTMPVLIEEYVETGKVRVEFHDVAFFGEESARAAAAARAAGAQGKYVEFVSAVYEAAPESGHPELPVEQLVQLAKQAGVKDLERFRAGIEDPAHRAAVDESTAMAQQLGVSGVPFFVADGQGMSGAQSIDTFRSFLDQAVEQAGAKGK